MSTEREEGGFIGRWSARKRDPDGAGARRRDAPEDGARVLAPESVPASPRQGAAADREAKVPGATPDVDPESDEPLEPPPLTDADMPPIGSLDATSDLSGFFSKGVSASLRRTALRHVFAQPSYNVRDGLNDYDGDYTVFEPLGDTVTSDMKFHAARHERERLRREAEEVEAEGKIEVSSTDEAEADGPTTDEAAERRDTDTGDASGSECGDRQRPEDETTSPGGDEVHTVGEPTRPAATVRDEIDSVEAVERPLNDTRTGRTDNAAAGSGDKNGTGHG